MFDKFGELGSYEEINMAAEGFFNEGDMESLRELAKENGIDEYYAELYIAGEIDVLCDSALTAAIGKIEVECQELKPEEIMSDWVEYIKGRCMESEQIAIAVRKKGKSLKGCIGEMMKWSFGHHQKIDQEIVKAAGINNAWVTLGIPGMGRAKKIIKEYYLGGEDK